MIERQRRWDRKSGVTILEVLVVLTIIAMIAAVVGPRLIGYLGRARSETASLQMRQLVDAVQFFYIDTGRYPATSEGLAALMEAPPSTRGWSGPYMESATALKDPWGRDYIYEEPGANRQIAIESLGRDGKRGGSGEDADLRF